MPARASHARLGAPRAAAGGSGRRKARELAHAPSGIATVMFTDLEASTETTTRLGDDAAASLFAQHDRIVRERSPPTAGASPLDRRRLPGPVRLRAQRRRLRAGDPARTRGARGRLRVRIGLNAGEVRKATTASCSAPRSTSPPRHGPRRTAARCSSPTPSASSSARCPARASATAAASRSRASPSASASSRCGRPTGPPHAPRRRAAARGARVIAAAALAAAAVAAARGLVATRRRGAPWTCARTASRSSTPTTGRSSRRCRSACGPPISRSARGSVWVGEPRATRPSRRSGALAPRRRHGLAGHRPRRARRPARAASGSPTTRARLARVIDPVFRSVARSVRRIGRPRVARPVAVTAEAVWIVAARAAGSRGSIRDSGRTVATHPGRQRAQRRRGRRGRRLGQRRHRRHRVADRPATPTTSSPRSRSAQSASGIAAGAGGVWVAVPLEDRVKRIDPATNAIADTVRVPGGPGAVAIGAGAVWVTSRRGGDGDADRSRDRARVDPHDPPRPQPPGRRGRRRSRLGGGAGRARPRDRGAGAADVLRVLRPERCSAARTRR